MSSTLTTENLQRFVSGQMTSQNKRYHYFYIYEIASIKIVENKLHITVSRKIRDNHYPYDCPEWIWCDLKPVKLDPERYDVSTYHEKICLKHRTDGEVCYIYLPGATGIIKFDDLQIAQPSLTE